MTRLRRGMLLASLAMAAAAPAALGAGTRVRVTPGTGGIHTRFVLRLSIPEATGRFANVDVEDSVSVTGNGRRGCVGHVELPLRPAPVGTAFRLTLNPSRLGGRWCTGRYRGVLVERRTTTCSPGPPQIVCLVVAIAPRVLGRFHFTVTPPTRARSAR